MNSENLISNDDVSLKDVLIKLKELVNYLRKKWKAISLAIIFGATLGFLYSYFKQPVYLATTTFVLEDGSANNGIGGSLSGLASMAGLDLGGDGGGIFKGDNILELYKSRTMIEKTLLTEVDFNGQKILLADRYIDINGLRDKWNKKPELKNFRFSALTDSQVSPVNKRLNDSILNNIVNDINKNYLNVAKPDKKLSIIKAEVKSKDEFFAKNFNQQIVKNVNDFYIQTKTKKSLDNVKILQQKTDSVRNTMNGAIYRAAVVNDATPNLNPTRQAQRAAPVQSSQFSAETNKAMLITLVQNLEMSKIALRKETPLIQVIDNPILPLEKIVFGKIKGMVIGGFIFGFLVTSIFLAKFFLNNL
mgnify:CR=1 FL=1